MKIKNISFETLVAVKRNTKDEETFQPQEIREVSQEDGDWYMERYNSDKHYFDIIDEIPVVTSGVSTELISETNLPPIEEKFICNVCNQEAGSKAGLISHMRKHK